MTDEDLDRMLGIPNARESAERRMAEIIREAHECGANLALDVRRTAGRWSIRFENPGDGVGPAYSSGDTFAEAWHNIAPAWAPKNDNSGGH